MYRQSLARLRILGKPTQVSASLSYQRNVSFYAAHRMSCIRDPLQKTLTPSFAATINTPYALVNSIKIVQNRNFASGDTFLDAGEVTERILAVVKAFDKCETSKVTPTAKFKEDLGLDSLDVVEVVMAIEEEFALEIPDGEADKISTIEEAIHYISAHPAAK